jgi:T3SS (YopN, CesT) and YbjN peptide-binding chaperone 3
MTDKSSHPWQDAASQIVEGLRRLTTEGGGGNSMTLCMGDVAVDGAYVRFSASRGSSHVHGEAVGNESLDRRHQLPPEKIGELEKLRFERQDEPPNFAREFEVSSEEQARELARLALEILERIYGCPRTSEVAIELTLE